MSKIDLVNELHRDARRNFKRRSTQMRGINDTLQADLVEMIPYAKQNQNMKYILNVINIFSKKAYARPLKNKSGPEVTKAMKSILNSMPERIKKLHVDMGKEFYNDSMSKMLRKRNISIYSTFSVKKAAIVERFNRTLKNKMWRMFSLRGTYKWIDILSQLIDDYNDTKHRTIKMTPNDVDSSNENHLLNTVYNRKWTISVKTQPKFKVGDKVRMSKYKHVFEKSYTPNWTTEIFNIKEVRLTNPVTYQLLDLNGHDIRGAVYEEELQIVKNPDLYLVEKILRKKRDLIYVKWLGFDNSHNSWINKKDML